MLNDCKFNKIEELEIDHNVPELAILIPSCDKYSDLWPVLMDSIARFWNPLPGKLYLLTNNLTPVFSKVSVIAIGEDKTWSANIINAISHIGQKYVMIFIDDLILYQHLDVDLIHKTIANFLASDGEYLRLNPTPAGKHDGRFVNVIPSGDIYRSSTVFSIWRKDVLLDVLKPSENAWEFEITGASRTDSYKKWFASSEWLVPYLNLVIKGKVDPLALHRLKIAGLEYSSDRQIMSPFEIVLRLLKQMRSHILNLLPRRLQRSIRQLFNAS